MSVHDREDGLGEFLSRVADFGPQAPYRRYVHRMCEITQEGLSGTLTEDGLQVESDMAFAVLQDATGRNPERFRDGVVSLLRAMVAGKLPPDEMIATIDTLVMTETIT